MWLIAEIIFVFVTAWVMISVAITAPFDRKRKVGNWVCKVWGATIFRLMGIEVIGPKEENVIEPPFIVMANHESLLDPPLMTWRFPKPLRFVAKKNLWYVPFLGQSLYLMGHIAIDRRNRKRAIESLKKAAEKIRAGTNVILFPEGTRAAGAKKSLLPFKKGGFMLAIEAKVPIIPVGIAGTADCMKKGSCRIFRKQVSYLIGEPIPTKEFTVETREQLMDKVRQEIDTLRHQARKILSAS